MMRLSRYLARAGIASRRGSERLIMEARVAVNGQVVQQLGTQVDEARDVVTFDGQPVRLAEQQVVIMLNKPAGYVTTMHDPQGRPCVAELVPVQEYPSLFPVGRLDRDTTGLLLFTNDGDLGHGLLHPSMHVEKRYIAHLSGALSAKDVMRLRRGVQLDDGMTAPAKVDVLKEGSHPVAAITIHEGRKRQVRRMFQAVGCRVDALHRASFGMLELGDLREGSWRELTAQEHERLYLSLR